MIYIFDIDGTICTCSWGQYENAEPYEERIKKINNLYDGGDKIIFFTARGMGRSENDVKYAYENFYDFTYNQLKKWGVKFHELYLGKPEGDIFVDDKGKYSEDFFNE